jgi:hypothetical protein
MGDWVSEISTCSTWPCWPDKAGDLTDPSSLCAQVLRAKYYPDDSLLKTEEQNDISYSWRSIVRGLEAIKEGIIWRVGNGDDINMWVDPWIPRARLEGRSLHGRTLSSQEFLNLLILRLGIGMESWFVIFFGRTMCNTFSPYPSSMAGRINTPGAY